MPQLGNMLFDQSYQEMKAVAVAFVKRHAAVSAPDVPIADVEAICRALGEISIDEATAALDRIQRTGK